MQTLIMVEVEAVTGDLGERGQGVWGDYGESQTMVPLGRCK